jgi:MFS family permease
MDKNDKKSIRKKILASSMSFIVLMALVSLFSDMTHEGANSMNGAFEDYLGAPDMVIAVVGGVATLLGCSLRMLTGYLADKTKRYWTFTLAGYAIDIVAVPLLALVPDNKEWGWMLAVSFIILEKIGKAVKKPAKDTIVSFAATENGIGKSFAFGEVLDQIGAFLGPVILTLVYLVNTGLDEYHKFVYGFLALGIPGLVCVILLIWAFFRFPHPEHFERERNDGKVDFFRKPAFILFVVASCFLAFGFLDSFSLINKDLYTRNVLGVSGGDYIPLLYSYAMLVDALSALVFGLLYDKKGFLSIAIATFMTAGYSFFLFVIPGLWSVFVGLTLWGIGMGAEESVMKSGITSLSGKSQRARAFGTYELFYGLFAFAGSFLIGWLYGLDDKIALCLFSSLSIGVSAIMYIVSDRYRKIELKAQNLIL